MTFVNEFGSSELLIQRLATHPLMQEMPVQVLHGLTEQAVLHTYRSGETVFHEGDTAQHWLLIECGQVELVRFGCDGNERVYHRFGAGQCVAEVAMFMAHGRYPMQARAVGPCKAWRMERLTLQTACAQHPALALRLLEEFSGRLYRYINEVECLASGSTPQRLAAYLLRLSADQGLQLKLPGSQRQLAAHLGVRPETLSRLLTQWQSQKWLSGERRSWTLLNTSPLHHLASALQRTF